jgi:hypothetical protein
MESAGAANSVCSLPPCGGGLGRGVVVVARDVSANSHPHPQPPPHKGEGSAPSTRRVSNPTGFAPKRKLSPFLFTPRGMAHYSRGGGDPNIVQHGVHRRHAHVRRRSRPPRIGCAGDTMAKIPLTFACGLYDCMQSLSCAGYEVFFSEIATRLPPDIVRQFRRRQ